MRSKDPAAAAILASSVETTNSLAPTSKATSFFDAVVEIAVTREIDKLFGEKINITWV